MRERKEGGGGREEGRSGHGKRGNKEGKKKERWMKLSLVFRTSVTGKIN